MTDFHTHILPRFDDGAESEKESVEMLKSLKAAGFERVVLSSHFYSNTCTAESFVKGRQLAFDKLKNAVAHSDVPKLHLAAEVYLTALLFNNENLVPLTIDCKGVMLTELPYDKKYSSVTAENLERLVFNCGLTPVLAHIERYPFLLDKGLLAELFDMGCHAQVNIGAFAGRHRRKLKKLADKGFLFTLGTDAHGMNDIDRINDYLAAAEKTVGKDYLESAFAYTKEKLIQC